MLAAGYAVVVADWRGTGCSGGVLNLGDERFRQDGYELIEWIADQEWSTDKVGMGGPSARGIATWHVASTRPPSLAAIAPQTFNANFFTGMTHLGGIPTFLSPLGWSLYSQPVQEIRVLRTADETCEVQAPKRLLLSNGRHSMSKTPWANDEIVRWFDRWLKGEDNGIDKEEHSVSIMFDVHKTTLKESYAREFSDWPPKGLQYMNWQLQADG
ncbi:CocE/NonD family hydrolase [Tunicatimonas pelagia]|uniref:CocE/NonD family hydrolase n=1 Tax=Tunicatimonas pelagia TaxID=931531 RepID=UPI0026651EB3|nr:CocE/NonD family hydrolase [Tunicatimonas pelagia]WKN42992.1 CocE/NonD family hydrolase [Tunicatimonas pelagia]